MTLIEAIKARHSVRKYVDKPISEDILSILRGKVEEINLKAGLHVQLVVNEPKAFGGIMAYGQFSGVKNYFIMAGPKADYLDEKIGYYGEQLVLLAQTLGLNTCWAGVSYNKISGTYELENGEKIGCYIALGYGLRHGSTHKIKSITDVSNADDSVPQWFKSGVESALLAPTAVNQQKFHIEYLGRKGETGKSKVSIKKGFSLIGYTQMDMGIAKLHFEIGAGPENFEWE